MCVVWGGRGPDPSMASSISCSARRHLDRNRGECRRGKRAGDRGRNCGRGRGLNCGVAETVACDCGVCLAVV